MRESFTGNGSIIVPPSECDALAATLTQRMSNLRYIRTEDDSYYSHYTSRQKEGRLLIKFILNEPDSYSNNSFSLWVNEQDQLIIHEWSNTAVVSNIEEVFTFITTCQKRIARRITQKSKRKKIRNLKRQAVIARVKKLAKDEKFDFCIVEDTVKLNLFIKLAEKEYLEIFIPFTKFDTILPQLRSVILALKKLSEQGIRYKHQKVTRNYITWTSYKNL